MAIKINGNTVIDDSQNFTSTGTVSATGNVTGGNIRTAGTISATGNVTAGNVIGNVVSTGPVSTTGNVTGGNVLTGGLISATGNITGNFFIGNGSQLTGIDATQIQSGTSNVKVVSSGGNVTTSVGGTSNVVVVATTGQFVTGVNSASGNVTGGNVLTAGIISATGNVFGGNALFSGNLTVNGNVTYINSNVVTINDLAINLANNAATAAAANNGGIEVGPQGSPYITFLYNNSANTFTSSAGLSATANVTGANLVTGGLITATGNIQGGNLRTAGLISATGAITGAGITGTSLTVSTGTVTCGNIVNANGNGVGNIGSSSTYFNTVFAKATSAQYADLAEKYTADADYEPGTVVMFGGDQEVTVCSADACRRVAGVISTNPSYIMNGTLESAHVATVALTGRVPCKVTGTARKGDLMVSAGNGTARAEVDPKVGTVIGKALADFDGTAGVIEVVVGRF